MCGVVDGGITPGLYGYEAGQSGVGDIFGWFVEHLAHYLRLHNHFGRGGDDVMHLLRRLRASKELVT